MHLSQLWEGGDPTVSCVAAWKGKIDGYEVVGKRSWLRLTYGCIFLLILPLHAKGTLPQNKFSKVRVKLVAKGSTGSLAGSSSRSCSPLPSVHGLRTASGIPCLCAPTSASRWQRTTVAAPSLAYLLSMHFTEVMCHHSSFCLSPA